MPEQVFFIHRDSPPRAAPRPRFIRSTRRGASRPARRSRSRVFAGPARRGYHAGELRGLYRIFNAAEYTFFHSAIAPPAESDPPAESNATSPWTPATSYTASSENYLALSWSNGVIDSGFYPVGPRGESYLILRVDGSYEEEAARPYGPTLWQLELRAGGVIRVTANYYQGGPDRADTWAIAYTTNGSTPATDSPGVTQTIPSGGLAKLSYDLPAQADGTTVKVRLQTRRDGIYSADSTVQTITADDSDPSTPLGDANWPGSLPSLF